MQKVENHLVSSDFSMLKLNREFQFVYKRGKSFHSNSCVLFFLSSENIKKIGYTASKKVGNAVKRNRSKRRLRALFSSVSKELNEGQYILVAKAATHENSFDEIEKDFYKVINSANQTKQFV
mgnify:CR=1 FL=1